MAFRVSGLGYEEFAPLFGLTDSELAQRHIVRRVVDATPGFPCRVSLQDAERGETVLLLNYEHLGVASPYRSRHAIYVRENARRAEALINEIPDVMRRRLLSLRAFDRDGMMIDADVTPGHQADAVIRRMFADERTEFIHAHNAKQGCFAARVDRAN